ncbi:MAG TPA: hypothetical protein VMG12_01505 [Polyangiaceae bacterium]|nr:hypothetical protein [Polyangiaceae bacterium]
MRRTTSWCVLFAGAPLVASVGVTGASAAETSGAASGVTSAAQTTLSLAETLAGAGNPKGECEVPSEARAVNMTRPDRIVGNGTPASCTGDAFIAAVAQGGKIAFNCGPAPVVITLDRPAKVFNDAAADVVIDGGGLVTLNGDDRTRILYMNTCDGDQHWTTTHCDNQETPRLTVQNITFMHGDSTDEDEYDGGGAIWARGGQLRVINSRFFNNTCVDTGPDVGGGAIRALSQYQNRPVYVVQSTFGGRRGLGNMGANGGALSSINVSWSIINSLFSYNRALGNGGNPAEAGTPGGGSGGAIYSDGMSNTLSICGSVIEKNRVNAFGSGVFFVNNDHGGLLRLEQTLIRKNVGGGWNVLPGVSMHEDTDTELIDSILE